MIEKSLTLAELAAEVRPKPRQLVSADVLYQMAQEDLARVRTIRQATDLLFSLWTIRDAMPGPSRVPFEHPLALLMRQMRNQIDTTPFTFKEG